MKTLITICAIAVLYTATAQDRTMLYANSRNTTSLYEYRNDSEFKYVLFYKNAIGADALAYEYLNFKSIEDLNLFLVSTIRSITHKKFIHMTMSRKDIYVYGVSRQTAVISVDGIQGLLNKADATELKSKLCEL